MDQDARMHRYGRAPRRRLQLSPRDKQVTSKEDNTPSPPRQGSASSKSSSSSRASSCIPRDASSRDSSEITRRLPMRSTSMGGTRRYCPSPPVVQRKTAAQSMLSPSSMCSDTAPRQPKRVSSGMDASNYTYRPRTNSIGSNRYNSGSQAATNSTGTPRRSSANSIAVPLQIQTSQALKPSLGSPSYLHSNLSNTYNAPNGGSIQTKSPRKLKRNSIMMPRQHSERHIVVKSTSTMSAVRKERERKMDEELQNSIRSLEFPSMSSSSSDEDEDDDRHGSQEFHGDDDSRRGNSSAAEQSSNVYNSYDLYREETEDLNDVSRSGEDMHDRSASNVWGTMTGNGLLRKRSNNTTDENLVDVEANNIYNPNAQECNTMSPGNAGGISLQKISHLYDNDNESNADVNLYYDDSSSDDFGGFCGGSGMGKGSPSPSESMCSLSPDPSLLCILPRRSYQRRKDGARRRQRRRESKQQQQMQQQIQQTQSKSSCRTRLVYFLEILVVIGVIYAVQRRAHQRVELVAAQLQRSHAERKTILSQMEWLHKHQRKEDVRGIYRSHAHAGGSSAAPTAAFPGEDEHSEEYQVAVKQLSAKVAALQASIQHAAREALRAYASNLRFKEAGRTLALPLQLGLDTSDNAGVREDDDEKSYKTVPLSLDLFQDSAPHAAWVFLQQLQKYTLWEDDPTFRYLPDKHAIQLTASVRTRSEFPTIDFVEAGAKNIYKAGLVGLRPVGSEGYILTVYLRAGSSLGAEESCFGQLETGSLGRLTELLRDSHGDEMAARRSSLKMKGVRYHRT